VALTFGAIGFLLAWRWTLLLRGTGLFMTLYALMEAVIKSDKSFEEILTFIDGQESGE